MNKMTRLFAIATALMSAATLAGDMWTDFANPPDSAKPWTYYVWLNGHADRETITADLEAIRRLGFGGINILDSRGYWDDENHVVNPKAELWFMSLKTVNAWNFP